MSNRILLRGGQVITMDPAIGDLATGDVLIEDGKIAAVQPSIEADAEVVDLRCLIPLDMATVLASVGRTSRLVVVEENPYQGGWGGTVVSIVADEGFELLDAPIRRVAAANVPLPFADALEDRVMPTVDKVVQAVRKPVAY